MGALIRIEGAPLNLSRALLLLSGLDHIGLWRVSLYGM